MTMAHRHIATLTSESIRNRGAEQWGQIPLRDSDTFTRKSRSSSQHSSQWGGRSVANNKAAVAMHALKATLERDKNAATLEAVQLKSGIELITAENQVLKEKIRDLTDLNDVLTRKGASVTLEASSTEELKAILQEQAFSIKKMERKVAETESLQIQLKAAEGKIKDFDAGLEKLNEALKLVHTESDCHAFLYSNLALIVKEFVIALKVAVSKAAPRADGVSNAVWKDNLERRVEEMELNEAVLTIYKSGMEIISQLNGKADEVISDPEILKVLFAAVAWEKDNGITALTKLMASAEEYPEDDAPGSAGVVSTLGGSSRGLLAPATPGSLDSRADQLRSPGYSISPMRPSASDSVLEDATRLIEFVLQMIVGRDAIPGQPIGTAFRPFPTDPFEVPDAASGNRRVEAFVQKINEFKVQVAEFLTRHSMEGSPVASISELFNVTADYMKQLELQVAHLEAQLGKKDEGSVEGMKTLRNEVAVLQKSNSELLISGASAARDVEALKRALSATKAELSEVVARGDASDREARELKGENSGLQYDLEAKAQRVRELESETRASIVSQLEIRSQFFLALPMTGVGVRLVEAATEMRRNGTRPDLVDARHLFEFPRLSERVSRESILEMLTPFEAVAGFFEPRNVVELRPSEFVYSAFYGGAFPSVARAGHIRTVHIQSILAEVRAGRIDSYSSTELIAMFTEATGSTGIPRYVGPSTPSPEGGANVRPGSGSKASTRGALGNGVGQFRTPKKSDPSNKSK